MNKRELDKGLMKMNEDIVIVGAGIAGLTTFLGLHRSQVASGLALNSSLPQKEGKRGIEVRFVKRKELLEKLEKELPYGTIRCSSKVVSIEDSGYQKLVHLADGTIIKTKVLVGCDGVNSLVAKWLGLSKPIDSGKSTIRGFVEYPEGHGFENKYQVFYSEDVRYGFTPCDDKCLTLFCTFDSSFIDDEDMEENPLKMKQIIFSRIRDIPKYACDVLEKTKLETLSCSILKLRVPWSLMFQDISKTIVCVAGDALHPMKPDLGQGGCSLIEDGIVLPRCLGEVFGKKSRDEKDEFEIIEMGLESMPKKGGGGALDS